MINLFSLRNIILYIYTYINLLNFTLNHRYSGSNTKTYAEKVISSGFEFEEHKILTKDGYILTSWRIPGKLGESASSINNTQSLKFLFEQHIPRQPIILQHGIVDDSWTWFALKAEDCLPIMLAKEGYDVWLPNSRGNIFSYEHTNPKFDSSSFSSEYWNFTFHEMIVYDFSANVDYIKNHTGFDKLYYIGHSQGTFMFFTSYLLDPDYMETHFEKFVAIGTTVTIFNTESPVIKFLSRTHIFNFLLRLHFNDFLDLGTSFDRYIHYFCSKFPSICKIIISSIIETKITNRVVWKDISDLYYYEPGGTSTKNVIHWIQVFEEKKLQQFDYGRKNKIHYGTDTPPEYNISNFKKWKIKSFITISDADPFSTEEDINFFLSAIDGQIEIITIKRLQNYNHLDYLWSSDAKLDLYVDILKFINN